jgi:tetratricopeptide (TPR) repeat protein
MTDGGRGGGSVRCAAMAHQGRLSRADGPIIGRELECRALANVIGAAASTGATILLVGEPGIGKSALLATAERSASGASCTVLAAVGVESEVQLPYAGLYELLVPILDRVVDLVPAQRDALLASFGLSDAERPERYLIALAALNLLTTVGSSQPVVAIADDLQWFDVPTQEALTFIARRAPAERLVFLGAMRSGHASPFLEAGLPVIELSGLDDASARRLLSSESGDLRAAQRDRIRLVAAGNPLALLELPRLWRGDDDAGPVSVPARLERAFAARIAELPSDARDILLAAAVDPNDDRDEILLAAAALRGSPLPGVASAALVDAQLLILDDDRARFRHPLIRSSVLTAEPLIRRQAANRALADVLDDPFRCTWHRALATVGPDDTIADEIEGNVVIALSRGGVMSAIRALERAAQLTSRPDRRGHRYLVAAAHAFELGRADLVARFIDAAASDDLSGLDRARMQWLREIFDEKPGDASRVVELCEAATLATHSGDDDLALNLLLGAALRCWWADTGPDARARVVAVTATIDHRRTDPRFPAVIAVADPVLQGSVVASLLDDVDADAADDGDALRLLGMAAHAIGDEPRAVDYLDRAEAVLRDQGRLGLLPHVLSMQVQIRLELGDWDRATDAADEGQRLALDTGQPIWGTGTLACAARAHALRGRVDEALELARQAEFSAAPRRLNDLLAVIQLVRGTAWLSAGSVDTAYDALARMFDTTDPSFHQRERFTGIVPFVEAAIATGHEAEAASVLAELEDVATTTPAPILHVHLLLARALLAGDGEHARRLFEAALASDLRRWPWLRAKVELAYGRWLRDNGRAAEANIVLRQAAADLVQIGAGVWLNAPNATLDD